MTEIKYKALSDYFGDCSKQSANLIQPWHIYVYIYVTMVSFMYDDDIW